MKQTILIASIVFITGCSNIAEQTSTEPISQQSSSAKKLEKQPPGKSCTLADGEIVDDGWRGKGTGNNYCNNCFCSDGMLGCTEMACPPVEKENTLQAPPPKPAPVVKPAPALKIGVPKELSELNFTIKVIPGGQVESVYLEDNALRIHFARFDSVPEIIYNDIKEAIIRANQYLPFPLGLYEGVGDFYVTPWHRTKSDHKIVLNYRCTYTPFCEEIYDDLLRPMRDQSQGSAMLNDSPAVFELVWPTADYNERRHLPQSHIMVAAHEWMHVFVSAHDIKSKIMFQPGLENIARVGPIWLEEGMADYIGKTFAQLYNTDDQYDDNFVEVVGQLLTNIVQPAIAQTPDINRSTILSKCETPADQLEAEATRGGNVDPSWRCVAGVPAVSYLMHLNNAESIDLILNYVTEMTEFGWQKSFARNFGRSVDEFYNEFGLFTTLPYDEQLEVIKFLG
jgi:hypothetical protein